MKGPGSKGGVVPGDLGRVKRRHAKPRAAPATHSASGNAASSTAEPQGTYDTGNERKRPAPPQRRASPPPDAVTTSKPKPSKSASSEASQPSLDEKKAEDAGPPTLPGVPKSRVNKFHKVLQGKLIDLGHFQELCWSGIPSYYRPTAWKLLVGYLPPNTEKWASTLRRRREEYTSCVQRYMSAAVKHSDAEQGILRQVLVDLPRTTPKLRMIHLEPLQRSLERVLYVWAIRHPASGYVQGINDLAVPFYAVFLHGHLDLQATSAETLDEGLLRDVEADVYWCLTRLVDRIQDHYTPSQPGIQRMIFKLRELTHRVDEALVRHLEQEKVKFMFAFRWCNCLLTREFEYSLVLRLWDTFLAEAKGLEAFHTHVCAAMLLRYKDKLKGMPYQDLLMFLQQLPTLEWGERELEETISQAYLYKTVFEAAPKHLVG